MRRVAPWLALPATALLALLALLAALGGLPGDLPPGPLGADPGAPNELRFPVEPGRPFSYGLIVLRNPASAPAELDSVELVGSSGLVLVAAAVRSLRDVPEHGVIANDASWPPPAIAAALRPAAGARIPHTAAANDALELVLGLRAEGSGVATLAAVAVRYRLGGRRYRAVFPFRLSLCVVPPDGSCDLPVGAGSPPPGVY